MMLSTLVLAASLALASATAAAASPEDWAPLNAFVGEWSGARVTPAGEVHVTRQYEPAAGNQQLEVTEKVGRNRMPWGVVVFDAERHGLVLRRIGAGGASAPDLPLISVSEDHLTLVFGTDPAAGASAVERITLQRHGWNDFVERVEVAADGKDFSPVSQTRFHRK